MLLSYIQTREADSASKLDFFAKLEAWESSLVPCKSDACPITISHTEGRYLHLSKRSNRNPTFGSCNPPPEVWAAYFRIKGGQFTVKDKALVEGFRDSHVFQGYGMFAPTTAKRRWFAGKRVLPWGSSGDFTLP